MSYKIINGSGANDSISTYDLNSNYPGYDGFTVYGLGGDDTLNSSFIGRNGVDGIDGGGGNDFMSLYAPYLTPLSTITNYAVFNGDFGTDRLYLTLVGSETYSNFRLDDGFIRFSVYGYYGEEVVVYVSPTVETIALGDLNYLTEDIMNGRIRAVDWNEQYARTYNENADWYLRGLNTYDEYNLGASSDGSASSPPSLVSTRFTNHTRNILQDRGGETLYYYIEEIEGVYELADGKVVEAFNHSSEDVEFISSIFEGIDQFIDLDFKRTYDFGSSDIDFYSVYDVSGWTEFTLGQVADQQNRSVWWDILWKDTDGDYSLSDIDKVTIVHEIGHALGLSHPNEDPTNPLWDQNDTVMSYNSGQFLQDWFTELDISALQSIWGVEDDRDASSGLEGQIQNVRASTWSADIEINRELIGSFGSGVLQAKQVEKEDFTGPKGSLIAGTSSNDIIRGLAGWDILDGGAGDDLIHGGNGRDIITGGSGSDELHGDFGWNTYSNQRDGSVDLIAIKSDQFLSNWWYGKAGNSPNGEKSDIIEGLDSTDQIKIIGVATSDLSFRDGISHKGVTGIGIYAKGVLEALYTGGDLSVSQISSMTTGDNSAQAMANQLWSYWGDNTVPALLA